MSLEKVIIAEFKKYLMACDRKVQRKFNEYLKKYNYLMFKPFHVDTKYHPSDDDTMNGVHIGFTHRILNAKEIEDADIWVETDHSETNVFYLYSPYSAVISSYMDGYLFISSSDIEELYIEPAPFEYAESLPVIEEKKPEYLVYSVLEYLNRDDVNSLVESMISKALKELYKSGDFRLEVIFNDTYNNTRGVPYGTQTIRVMQNDEVLGYISASGYDLHNIQHFVMSLKKWNSFMQEIVDKSQIRDIISNTVQVVNTNTDCDVYFSVPKFSNIKHNERSK